MPGDGTSLIVQAVHTPVGVVRGDSGPSSEDLVTDDQTYQDRLEKWMPYSNDFLAISGNRG